MLTNDQHHRIAQRLATVGITPPDGVRRALDLDAAMATVATTDPLDALRDGITTGALDPDDAAAALADAAAVVTAQATAERCRADLQRDLAALARRSLADSADDVLKALRPTFDGCVATLADCLDVLGPELHKGAQRTERGSRAVHDRQRALDTLRAVRLVRQDLASVRPDFGAAEQFWFVSNPERVPAASHRFWDLLSDGFQLHLNTPKEALAAEATATEASAQRERARLRAVVPEGERKRTAARADAEMAARRSLVPTGDEAA